jgi:D-methionine transport system ATP-binding protein
LITLDHITKVFPGTRSTAAVSALQDVSLHVPTGEVMGVVGPSGSGKSTLVRCVNLLERPTSGTVVVAGQELTALSHSEVRAARRRIGMIFQHFNLLDSRTAGANVEHPLQLAGVPQTQRRARAAELLALVGLADKRDTHPRQLSGGQKQRVAIARALAAEPAVLLCDEATSALDPTTTGQVLDLIRRLTAELGLTTLLITHEMDVVKRVCDSVTLLERGRVVDSGRLADVVRRPDSVLATHLVPAPASTGEPQGAPVVEVVVGGPEGERSVLSDLVRRFDIDVDVVAGSVETIGGQRFGRLRISLHGDTDSVRGAIAHLSADSLVGTR